MVAVPPRIRDAYTHRRVATLLSVLAGVAIFVTAETVFPYHTSNHDEAVYLHQAAMLLEGQLFIHPPVEESFRPWFFVVDGDRLYPKYTPVTAAIFAGGKLLGGYTVALAVVATGTVSLTYATVREAFDGATGVVAAVLLLASPLFVVDASVFLSYVPTFTLNLLFAWAYLRADRTERPRWGALAGGAIGLAFFSRPYTAVLFALPFIAHALWTLRTGERAVIRRQGATAALGLAGVAVTLGYNAVVTGDPLVFPYEAFAPKDGLGFGRREILGYERTYDLSLALRANQKVLWTYVTDWSVAPPLGVVTALAGLGVVASRQRSARRPRRLVLAGLFLTIILGNVYFWGNLNILGELSDPTDGLVTFLGPYYHVGLLLPTATFGAVAVVSGGRAAWPRLRGAEKPVQAGAALLVVVSAVLVGSVAVDAVRDPLADNYEVTQQYEVAYEPFEERSLSDALVFLPDPYGPWLGHPFQALRNDPGFDGDVVYALETNRFAVVEAYPDRSIYRYAYREQWHPYTGESVTPRLQEVDVTSGERVGAAYSFGVPRFTEAIEIRVSSGTDGESATATMPSDGIEMNLTIESGRVVATSPEMGEELAVSLNESRPIKTTVFVDTGGLGGFEYVFRLPVDRNGETYRVLTPRLEVCRSPRLCGNEAAYVPGAHRENVWMNATLTNERGDLTG